MALDCKPVFRTVCCLLVLLGGLSRAHAIELSREERECLRPKRTVVFVSQTRYPPFESVSTGAGGLLLLSLGVWVWNGRLRTLIRRKTADVVGREEALRDSEERFRSIFDTSLDGIFFSAPDGVIIAANPAACRMLGWSEQEIREGGRNLVVDTADPRLPEAVEEWRRTGRFQGELNFKRKDGTLFPVELSSTLFTLANGQVRSSILFRDISERTRAEEALREAHRRLDAIIEFFPDATIVVDQNGRVTHWNKAIEEMTGVRKADMLQKGDHEYALPFYGERRPILVDIALGKTSRKALKAGRYDNLQTIGETYSGEAFVLRTSRGKGAYLSATASPLHDSQGNITGAIESIRDITKRKLAEEALKTSLQEKEVLLREIHHRVKNNMQLIISLLTLQAEKSENEQVRKTLLDSQQRIVAMAMIHEALYSEGNLATLDLSAYLSNIVRHLQGIYGSEVDVQIALKLERIDFRIDQAVPCGLIINELITNCFKHAFPKGTKGTIQIDMHMNDEEEVALVVSDDGVGLSADLNLNNPSSLGLRLVQGFLKHQLKGRMSVASERGTTFTLRWPLQAGNRGVA